MKFCPKCSLKIKGNISHCPLCRVELLSYAEDEGRAAMVNEGKSQEQLTDKSKTAPTESLNHTSLGKWETQRKNAENSKHAEAPSDLTRRVETLEYALTSLESKFDSTLSHAEIVKGTILDLESRITTFDRSLAALKTSPLTPSDGIQAFEEEISHLAIKIDQLGEEIDTIKASLKEQHSTMDKLSEACNLSTRVFEEMREAIETLEARLEKSKPSLESKQPSPGLPFGTTERGKDTFSFAEKRDEDFRTEFEPSFPSSTEEASFEFPQERKRNYLLILSAIAVVFIISVWLGFYYKSTQENTPLETTVTETSPQILATPSEVGSSHPTILPELPKGGVKEDALPPQELSTPSLPQASTKAQPAVTTPQVSPLKKVAKKPAPPQTVFKKTIGYTVNAGSFKERKKADSLATSLKTKGYPAVVFMDQKWFKVTIGNFSSLNEARAYAATIKRKEKLSVFATEIK